MNYKNALSTVTLALLAAALTVVTVVFAPLPLLLLRRHEGRKAFGVGVVFGGLVLALLGSPTIVCFFAAAALLSFIFCECENQDIGYAGTVLITVLVVTGFISLAGSYAVHQGFNPVQFFREQIQMALTQLSLPSGITVDKEALIRQVPSALLILVIMSVWINSILAPRVETLLGWGPRPKYVVSGFKPEELTGWKVPDSFVWIALVSAGGAFFEFEPAWLHWVAVNVFNLAVMLYFFQGLAIIVNFFVVKKVSYLWRTVAYLFIFSQLFLMVAFLGYVDLWMDFRGKAKTDKSAVA